MSDPDPTAAANQLFTSLWLCLIAAVALVLVFVLIEIFVRWTRPAMYATVVGIVTLITLGLVMSFLVRSRENARSHVAQGNLRAIGAAHSSRAELNTLNQEPRPPERLSPSANDPAATAAEPAPTTDWTPPQLLIVLGSFVVLLALAVGGTVGWLLRWQSRHSADTDDNEVADLEPWEEPPPAQPGAPLSS